MYAGEPFTWQCDVQHQTRPNCCGTMSWPGGRGSDRMAPAEATSAGPSAQRTTAMANTPPPERGTRKDK